MEGGRCFGASLQQIDLELSQIELLKGSRRCSIGFIQPAEKMAALVWGQCCVAGGGRWWLRSIGAGQSIDMQPLIDLRIVIVTCAGPGRNLNNPGQPFFCHSDHLDRGRIVACAAHESIGG